MEGDRGMGARKNRWNGRGYRNRIVGGARMPWRMNALSKLISNRRKIVRDVASCLAAEGITVGTKLQINELTRASQRFLNRG